MKDRKKVQFLTLAAVIAALYAALTAAQHLIAPGTASMAVQFRISEAMTMLAVLTPAAIPGLTLGCFLVNFLFLEALPVDMILGSLATLLALQACQGSSPACRADARDFQRHHHRRRDRDLLY